MQKVIVVGLGELGGWALELLARTPGGVAVVGADANEDMGLRRVNNALLGALQMGYTPRMKFRKVDVLNTGQTAEVIAQEKPEVIYNATSLQSWWVITQLPKEAYHAIDQARFGPWVPMHLALTYKLMLAVKESGHRCHVVSSSFPDAVNPSLAKLGLAPAVGIGNIDMVIPSVQVIVAQECGVHPENVQVFMCAPHYVSYYLARYATTGGAPYYLKLLVDGRDVTGRFPLEKLYQEIPVRVKRLPGLGSNSMVASSAVKNVLAILNDAGIVTHAPGPCGLPGGYPVRLDARGAEVVPPPGISLEEAVRINEEAQRFDGIERIEDDGTIVITEKSNAIMKELLGYDCPRVSPAEAYERAMELKEKFNKWVAKVSGRRAS